MTLSQVNHNKSSILFDKRLKIEYNNTCKVIILNSLQVMCLLEKKIRMGELFDFYGKLLTERQQEFIELYYNQDLSLGEIAEKYAVSRQAVYDNLRRSEKILEEYEAKLNLLARTELIKEKITKIKELMLALDCDPIKRDEILKLIKQLIDA